MVQKKITTKTSITLKGIVPVGDGMFSNEDGDVFNLVELLETNFDGGAFDLTASVQVNKNEDIINAIPLGQE